MNEFNSPRYDNDLKAKNEAYTKRPAFNESADETPDYSEVGTPKSKKKAKGLSKVFSVLTASVAAVATAAVVVPAIITSNDSTKVNFAEISSTDTSIVYYISLEDRSDGDLTFVLYNEFTERQEKIEGDEIGGEVTGLKPNMVYTLAVKNGSRTLAKTTCRTKRPDEMPQTVFRGVNYRLDFTDGAFLRFTLDFIDENVYWFNYGALIMNDLTRTECTFTEDLHAEQSIDVSYFTGSKARFIVYCMSWEPVNGVVPAEPVEKTLFETEIEIII